MRKLKSRVNDKVSNPKVIKSKAVAMVTSRSNVFHPVESGQGDGAMHRGEKR